MKQNKLANIWHSIVDFVCYHWQLVVSLVTLITLGIVCIWGHTPSSIYIALILINALCFYIFAAVNESEHAYAVTSICLFLIWSVGALGISIFWCLIPIFIMAISALIDDVTRFCVCVIVFFNAMTCFIGADKQRLYEAKKPEHTIEVVINEIEKRDYNDIMVVVTTDEGELRILEFSSSVKDAWRLEKGDSIGINILYNRIIYFEKK